MRVLAIDTSSQSASCALTQDGMLLGECFSNVKLTHSQTIMPMTESLLAQTRTALADVDFFAVTDGPGSFTGLRIGLSAVKGMAHALDKPCVPVSTLEALAWNLCGFDGVIAPVLDARCSQVYTALFRWESGTLVRLADDEAITVAQLEERLKNVESRIFLVGDGTKMCYTVLNGRIPRAEMAPPALRYVRASSAAFAAECRAASGRAILPEALAPAYLRLPQAERELLAKQSK